MPLDGMSRRYNWLIPLVVLPLFLMIIHTRKHLNIVYTCIINISVVENDAFVRSM